MHIKGLKRKEKVRTYNMHILHSLIWILKGQIDTLKYKNYHFLAMIYLRFPLARQAGESQLNHRQKMFKESDISVPIFPCTLAILFRINTMTCSLFVSHQLFKISSFKNQEQFLNPMWSLTLPSSILTTTTSFTKSFSSVLYQSRSSNSAVHI